MLHRKYTYTYMHISATYMGNESDDWVNIKKINSFSRGKRKWRKYGNGEMEKKSNFYFQYENSIIIL